MSYIRRAAARISGLASLPVITLLLAAFAGPAAGDVALRLEARPVSDPIQAFITVTNGGTPQSGLVADDFDITIDGVAVIIADTDVTLPPSQDPNQKVSIVFAMDYSSSVTNIARAAMEAAVVQFIDTMNDGDFAGIVKFNDSNPMRASVVMPLTEIDTVAGNAALVAAVQSDYPGVGTNLLDGLDVSLNHFLATSATLPAGPKSIILISDGGENQSTVEQSDVIQLANDNSIPIFVIGVGNLSLAGREELLSGIGSETGGEYFPTATDQEIADAYAAISTRLNNEYLITIPSGIADCTEHEFEVTVAGQAPTSLLFTRRVCDTTPDPFSFTAQNDVRPERFVTSNTVTITGIEEAAHISVISGTYAIGCTDNFTTGPATITNGQTVCVRQETASNFSTTKTSTLTVGGVAGTFATTTSAGDGGGGGGGGGGATGLLELLLGLGVLLLGRRRAA